jgi:hypothetical protein
LYAPILTEAQNKKNATCVKMKSEPEALYGGKEAHFFYPAAREFDSFQK